MTIPTLSIRLAQTTTRRLPLSLECMASATPIPTLWGSGKSNGWGMYVVENGVIHTTLSIGGLWSKGSIFSDTQGTLWGTSNDGSGSGLDADTVDGIQGSVLLRSDTNNSVAYTSKTSWYSNTNGASTAGAQSSLEVYSPTTNADAFMTFHVSGDYAGYFGLDGTTNDLFWGGWSRGAAKYRIWHAANDGSGSGLDADTCDGQHLGTSASVPTTAPALG
jgi:hypothetical protein